MSQLYSTGELAKLAGVSVRTVQYYDQRGILPPTELSEGGRRLYSDKDRQRLEVISFLRDMDFSIEQIKKVLAENNANQVLDLLLEDQIRRLDSGIQSQKEKLAKANRLKKSLSQQTNTSLETLRDMSMLMKTQDKWRRNFWKVTIVIALISALYVAIVIIDGYFLKTRWLTFSAMPIFFVSLSAWMIHLQKSLDYLCPNCHQVFDSNFKEFALAGHTPRTRKLTCPHCHKRSYCLEMAKEN